MAIIFNHLAPQENPGVKSGKVNVNSANVYPSTLTATSGGLDLTIDLLDNHDRFTIAQTSLATDKIILPSAAAAIGTRIVFYATSAASLKAGADSSGYTINGGADTASYAIPAGGLVVIEKATSTNWIAEAIGDAASETLTGKTLVSPVISGSPTGDGITQWVEVALTNAEMLALRATPKTLVAAPGAGKILEFVAVQLYFDYTGAYTETADNMAVRYENGSGAIVSQAIEATGFVDATADTITNGLAKIDAIVAKTGSENKALVLHNTGDGEYGGGNAANAVRAKVTFRVWSTGF